MNHYTPLWNKITDSSLWQEEDYIVKIFLTMLAKKDHDDVVRGSAFALSRWANKTELEVLKALKILSSPDTKRIEKQPFDGRRIEKVDDGWLVLNGAHYRAQMSKDARKDYKKFKQREYRAKGRVVTGEVAAIAVEDAARGREEAVLPKASAPVTETCSTNGHVSVQEESPFVPAPTVPVFDRPTMPAGRGFGL